MYVYIQCTVQDNTVQYYLKVLLALHLYPPAHLKKKHHLSNRALWRSTQSCTSYLKGIWLDKAMIQTMVTVCRLTLHILSKQIRLGSCNVLPAFSSVFLNPCPEWQLLARQHGTNKLTVRHIVIDRGNESEEEEEDDDDSEATLMKELKNLYNSKETKSTSTVVNGTQSPKQLKRKLNTPTKSKVKKDALKLR